MKKIMDFLNLDYRGMDKIMENEERKIYSNPLQKGEMLPKTRQLLNEFFNPFNKDLSAVLKDSSYLWETWDFKFVMAWQGASLCVHIELMVIKITANE